MTNADFKNHEFQIIQELWALYKKHYLPEAHESFDGILEEFSEVIKRYQTELCADIADALLRDIDRRWKDEHKTQK